MNKDSLQGQGAPLEGSRLRPCEIMWFKTKMWVFYSQSAACSLLPHASSLFILCHHSKSCLYIFSLTCEDEVLCVDKIISSIFWCWTQRSHLVKQWVLGPVYINWIWLNFHGLRLKFGGMLKKYFTDGKMIFLIKLGCLCIKDANTFESGAMWPGKTNKKTINTPGVYFIIR